VKSVAGDRLPVTDSLAARFLGHWARATGNRGVAGDRLPVTDSLAARFLGHWALVTGHR
jgi:hypothetical protein